MKKVVTNKELQDKIDEAIELLCGTVKKTLGPKGNNIIIDHSSFSPFITNDGVTIARNIESDDEITNTILELAKESSIKTDDKVGDGTTTTLVLLESIYKNGRKAIEKGINPILLKKEIDKFLPTLIEKIKKKSYLPEKKDLKRIAKISSNSEEIGNIVSEVFDKIKTKNSITLSESQNEKTEVIYKHGYILETLIASDYFFKDKEYIDLNNPLVLVIDNYVNDLNKLENAFNFIIDNKKSLLIFAEDYSDKFINEILSLYLYHNINIYLLKIPEYGKNKLDVIDDLVLISNCKVIENEEYISLDMFGESSHIKIEKKETIISFKKNKKIEKKVEELKQNNSNEFSNKRIAMFNYGLAEIKVGAITNAERREKKMRYEDSLCALESSKDGVIPGSGIVLYEVSESLSSQNEIEQIFKQALKEPFNQIMINSGLNNEEIIKEIKKSKYKKIYNVYNDNFENINNTEVLDSLNVVINSLANATSTASMLLTTTSLIINEYQNNINKINDYQEL